MSSRRMPMVLVLGLSMAMLSGQALAQGPVKLRYQFKKGESLNYTMVVDQNMQISSAAMPGIPQNMSMTMTMDMYQKATKLEKAAAMIEMGFTKFSGQMSMGGAKMPIPGLEGMTKLRMSMRMTDRGQMSEPQVINPGDLDMQLMQVAEQMKSSITQNSLVFPDKTLSVGDTWDISQDLPTPVPGADEMKMKLKSTYKLLGIEQLKGKKCAKISADVKLSLHGEASQNGVPLRADMEGSGSGVNFFAVEEGKMVSSEATFDLAGKVTATAKGQKVDTNLKMSVSMKLNLK